MFLPPRLRVFAIGLYAYLAWQFLALGAVFIGGGVLRTLEGNLEGIVLFPMGAFMCYVGSVAIRQLQQLNPPGARS